MEALSENSILTILTVVLGGVFAIISTVLTVALGAVITIFSITLKSEKSKREALENSIIGERREVYQKFMGLFFRSIHEKVVPTNEEWLELKYKIMFYGSDNLIRKYNDFMKLSEGRETNIGELKVIATRYFADMLLLMRKDLGYPETKVSRKDLLQLVITDDLTEKDDSL